MMAKKHSAGLLVYRRKNGKLEVLIARMGGPWFKNKEKGAWSIPKGEYTEDEDPKKAAVREFREELSLEPPTGEWIDLETVEQSNRKIVAVWAVEGDLDVSHTKSNMAKGEWPPRSGKIIEWPEIERAEWLSLKEAAKRLVTAQIEFLDRLAEQLGQEFKQDSNDETSQQALL